MNKDYVKTLREIYKLMFPFGTMRKNAADLEEDVLSYISDEKIVDSRLEDASKYKNAKPLEEIKQEFKELKEKLYSLKA